MNLIRRLFPFRTCTIDIQEGQRALPRPCLLYHIKRCQGPCIEAIDKDAYRADIDQVMLFLEGRQEQVAKALREEMTARVGRDGVRARGRAARQGRAPSSGRWKSQKMAAFARRELDVLGYRPVGQRGRRAAVRDPRREDRRARRVPAREPGRRARRGGAVRVHASSTTRPRARCRRACWCPGVLPDAEELDAFLRGAARQHRRRSTCPSGARAGRSWPSPAGTPPRRSRASRPRWLADQGRTLGRARGARRRHSGLPAPPMRIECYDISTIQGTNTVGSMVVFEEGRPRSGEYRRFRDPDRCEGTDDFASHREVLRRRFKRALASGGGERRGAALAAARPGHHRRRQGPGERRARACSTSWACTTCRWPAWPRSARSCSCPGAVRPDRAAGDLAGALPRPAPARRGAPVRDHLPPQAARQGADEVGARRAARASARRASGRCCASSGRRGRSSRRHGRGDRRGARASAKRSRRGYANISSHEAHARRSEPWQAS